MKKPESSFVPESIREAGYMAGWYEWTPEADADSKYFRYQTVPADSPCYRNIVDYGVWDYSADDERQRRFQSLIEDGVLSAELADYLERHYLYRYNMFFVGGNGAVRRALMDAVAATRPELNVIEVSDGAVFDEDSFNFDADASPDNSDEPVSLNEPENAVDAFPATYWELAEERLLSRDDVLFYDGSVPDEVSVKLLVCHAVHHIVLAGFARGEDEHMRAFRPTRLPRSRANNFQGGKEEFNSLTVRLRQVEVPGKGFVTEVAEVIKYENNMNSAPDLEEVAWTRVVSEWVHVPSTVVY